MASTKIFATGVVFCLLSLFHKMDSDQLTNRDISSLLSVLNRKIVGNKKPVIIILKKDSGLVKQIRPTLLSSSNEHERINVPHLLHEKSNKGRAIKQSTPSYLNLFRVNEDKNRLRQQAESIRDDDDSQRIDKDVLRSPIVKKLLRISNSLRCNAKDNCQDKCNNKYSGKKVVTCNYQCEVKYECDEPAEEKDPCESGCEDSCDNNECNMMSTKGEKLEPEEVKCKRC